MNQCCPSGQGTCEITYHNIAKHEFDDAAKVDKSKFGVTVNVHFEILCKVQGTYRKIKEKHKCITSSESRISSLSQSTFSKRPPKKARLQSFGQRQVEIKKSSRQRNRKLKRKAQQKKVSGL
jgi:hypothetical protein